MVRKGSSVRVRQRAFRSSLLLRGIADLPDPADAARVFVKVPRRYRAGRHGFARLTNHVDRGAPRKALELLEDARVVPQARGRRVPELGRELDDVDAFVDEQAREAATQIARARVAWHADRGPARLEDPPSPVVPVAARPPPPASWPATCRSHTHRSPRGTQGPHRMADIAAASGAGPGLAARATASRAQR